MTRKVIVTIQLLMVLFLVSCNRSYPYPYLLSNQEGKFFILYIGEPENGHMKTPELIQKVSQQNVTGTMLLWNLENAQKEYPILELENTPVFLIFDTKGLVLKTMDEQKAKDYLFGERH